MTGNRIRITAGTITVEAELGQGPTAQRLWEMLPIEGRASTWGDEIYFEIPLQAEQEPEARAEVEIGALAYWPVGSAFCIFFGRTPASTDDRPRAYSPVNPLGRVLGDATVLRDVPSGAPGRIERHTGA